MRWILALALLPTAALSESVVATRTIRPQEIISADAVRLDPTQVNGAYATLDAVVGQEARVAIYPGRVVLRGSVGEPALVDRNQAVELIYEVGGLTIRAEGRALARGAVGERIRVMNSDSRTVLFGTVASNGSIMVSR
ncbi:flagellar basal body P-ring formation chaperone FlgA [Maliponia aquimaris]|uniref:Flagella basal body P-ring formation protein FlgA n=1 Tax=Maliponia aquimaris TaxID=1673631 RepID=A0A238JNJ4_9RHOB|nr:flagellar basal body P-ring formation chaperone FlgA [Maliponia aquimaris]SMX32239.1 flagellar basal body P-ring biosynthesis protein FlgA [Maliponia aquimaris]